MESKHTPIQEKYQLKDEQWEKIKAFIPGARQDKKVDGRPRMNDRKALQAILYVLRTGCQWNALPRSLGSSSTVHDRFQEWEKAGLFQALFKEGIIEYDKKKARVKLAIS